MNKKYIQEFKQQIADLYNDGNKSLSVLESENSVSKSTIHGWIKKYSKIDVTMAEYKKL